LCECARGRCGTCREYPRHGQGHGRISVPHAILPDPPFSNGRSRAGFEGKRISSAAQIAAAHGPRTGLQNLEDIGAGEGLALRR
jgi:hypothetical protein